MTTPDWPAADVGLAFHRRLVELDPVAPPAFMTAYFGPLLAELECRNPTLDEAILVDVVTSLFFEFVQNSVKFDPNKSALRSYLLMAAAGDVKNALAKIGRRKRHETGLESVAEPAADGNKESEDDIREWLNHPIVVEEVATFTPVEHDCWRLMLAGERTTTVYADVLGITGLPPAEQARRVKNVKDRLTKRLKRLRGETA